MALLISSSLLAGQFEAVAQLTTTNIDTEEPSVIQSPDSDRADGFGWAAVFHTLETVSESDTMEMSLNKTR